MRATVLNRPLKGRITAPPSKSATHRALILQRLIGGSVERPLVCEDTEATRRCLDAFDAGGVMDAGESATTLRLMLPLAIARYGRAEFRAKESLIGRPMDAFGGVGISVWRDGEHIRASGRLEQRRYDIDATVSSQFASGLMIALAYAGGGAVAFGGDAVSRPYIMMTAQMLETYGAGVSMCREGENIVISVRGGLVPADVTVERDWSYAAGFMAAGALGGSIEIDGLSPDSVQGDRAVTRLLTLEDGLDVTDTPDLLPCLMAAACGRGGRTVISGTGRLKYKESDRPRVMADVINALGGKACVDDDSVTVFGTGRLAGGEICAFDHRIAMAAAILAAISDRPVIISGAECVNKSAPQFWSDIRALGGLSEEV